MTKLIGCQNLFQVKTALADKYDRLAVASRSKPARTRLLHHAKRFRQQADAAGRRAGK